MSETLGDRVREQRKALGLTQRQLAERVTKAGFPITQVAIYNIEHRGDTNPRCIVQLAQALEVKVEWLQTGADLKRAVPGIRPGAARIVHPPFAKTRDVPVLAATLVSGEIDWGQFELSAEPAEFTHRPLLFANRKLWAFAMPDNTMSPWRKEGHICLIDDRREAWPGEHILIKLKRDNASDLGIVRLLIGNGPDYLKVYQYRPGADDFAPGREQYILEEYVSSVHRIVDYAEMLATSEEFGELKSTEQLAKELHHLLEPKKHKPR